MPKEEMVTERRNGIQDEKMVSPPVRFKPWLIQPKTLLMKHREKKQLFRNLPLQNIIKSRYAREFHHRPRITEIVKQCKLCNGPIYKKITEVKPKNVIIPFDTEKPDAKEDAETVAKNQKLMDRVFLKWIRGGRSDESEDEEKFPNSKELKLSKQRENHHLRHHVKSPVCINRIKILNYNPAFDKISTRTKSKKDKIKTDENDDVKEISKSNPSIAMKRKSSVSTKKNYFKLTQNNGEDDDSDSDKDSESEDDNGNEKSTSEDNGYQLKKRNSIVKFKIELSNTKSVAPRLICDECNHIYQIYRRRKPPHLFQPRLVDVPVIQTVHYFYNENDFLKYLRFQREM